MQITNNNAKHHALHWHYLKRRRSRRIHHNTKEILVGQIVAVVGAIFAGYILELNKAQLITMAGAFLILPGIFDLGGSIAGAMGARINHHLQLDTDIKKLVRHTLKHSFLLLSSAGIIVALIGSVLGSLFFDGDYIRIFTVAYVSVIVAGLVGLPIVAYGTIRAYKKGFDPDNIIGPIETTVFDILTVIVVSIMVTLTA
jgi:mgtE-like transporter